MLRRGFQSAAAWPPVPQLRETLSRVIERDLPGSIAAFRTSSEEGEIAEILDRHLVKRPADAPSQYSVLTTRREALSLYRDVLRLSRLFTWEKQPGVLWGDEIRRSARLEFEAGRLEHDPEMVARLLLTGRDYVTKTQEMLRAKAESMLRK
eukprot:jgi/Mesvir1/8403/Mv24075-RA.1